MNTKHRISFLIGFAVFTSFGSSLSAIGTFLALGRTFQDVTIVAIALSLKTLSSVLLTRFTRSYALKRGVYHSLFISQISGIPLLAVMAFGFYLKNTSIILIGVFLSGIPGNLLNLVLAPMLKELAHEEDVFKKWQGLQQTLIGIGSLIAAFSSPWILDGLDVYGLYIIDGVTFIVAAILLFLERYWYIEKFKSASISAPIPSYDSDIKIKDI
ncbi:MAG: hypothetical protein QE271_04605 [Bacteriovoracaceae bacterium]|nr:hypothetical protein [Bacteriovoracaceae bacterium]